MTGRRIFKKKLKLKSQDPIKHNFITFQSNLPKKLCFSVHVTSFYLFFPHLSKMRQSISTLPVILYFIIFCLNIIGRFTERIRMMLDKWQRYVLKFCSFGKREERRRKRVIEVSKSSICKKYDFFPPKYFFKI